MRSFNEESEIYTLIGYCYFCLVFLFYFMDQKEYNEAIESFKEVFKYDPSLDDKKKCDIHRYLGYCYYNRVYIYIYTISIFEQQKYDKSLLSYNQAMKYSSEVDEIIKFDIYLNIGKLYYKIVLFMIKSYIYVIEGIQRRIRIIKRSIKVFKKSR